MSSLATNPTAAPAPKPRQQLKIETIRTDGGTQPRAAIDCDTVCDYTDDMRDGVKFPPITVFYDGTTYWLAGGFHQIGRAHV